MKLPHLLRRATPLALPLVWLVGCTPEAISTELKSRLVVSQVLYRSGVDSLEWLELQNEGSAPAKLAGLKIKAIGYEFDSSTPDLAPDGRIILTNSEALFAKHHPGTRINGVFTGRLADEGEKIKLEGADGGFELSYSDGEPWPAGPAKVGASLVYKGGDPAKPSSWASSARIGGSPRQETPIAIDKGVRISEIRPADGTGGGFVEIATSSSEQVDLSGWILTSALGSPHADTLPTGTALAAQGRLLLRQSPTKTQLGWGSLLPLPSGGELLLLERGSDGGLTGSVQTFRWDFVPEGSSAARIGSTGTEPDISTALPTPDSATLARSAGPVTISEVCYAPVAGDAEFVELRNETDSVVHLGFAQDPSRSWRLTGIDKDFSATDSIGPRATMVLVSESDMQVSAFRTKWNIPDSVAVLTYSGRLDNAGETVRLRRPSRPVPGNNGSTGWADLVVDAAAWLPTAPWPTSANANGTCLRRIATDLPGTSFHAWEAAQPTPGK